MPPRDRAQVEMDIDQIRATEEQGKDPTLPIIPTPRPEAILSGMVCHQPSPNAALLDERSPIEFRHLFGSLLSRSRGVETAINRIRLGAVDLSAQELMGLRRFRVLVAEVNAQTVEGEAYALAIDPSKRENLTRILHLLQAGVMEIRSAPLGGWSPDFTVFSEETGPHSLLVGIHWFHRPFPFRGPAWTARFGPAEAARAQARFRELWEGAHDIGPAIRRLMERTALRAPPRGPSHV